MKSCSDWRLYVIVDRTAIGSRPAVEVAAAAIRGGADVIQLRDKEATDEELVQVGEAILNITRRVGIPLIVNDRVSVAQALGSEGVHLGQEDWGIAEARVILGKGQLVGKSTHSLEQAVAAQVEGADYIGAGPLFPTPTKPRYESVGLGLVNEVEQHVRIPAIAIGGINADNVQQVLEAGAQRIAVVRAVCGAPDPESAARVLKQKIVEFHRPKATSSL